MLVSLCCVCALVTAPAVATASYSDGSFTSLFSSLSAAGFVGGDIGGSARLSDGRTAWFFGDTVTACTTARLTFAHNSLVVTGRGRPEVVPGVLPNQADGSFFWPGAARADRTHVWVLALRVVQTGRGVWDFRVDGTWLARLDVAGWHVDVLRPVAGGTARVNWSSALFGRGAYTYIYGVEMDGLSSWLHVARVPRDRLESPWQFYARRAWRADPRASARILSGVSSISIVGLGSRGLRLVTQQPLFGREVYSWRAATPTGPFFGRRTIYVTSSFGERTYTYNAIAHAQHATGADMLFSFNVNSHDLLTPSTASLYRPRFFRVAFGAL